MTSKRIKYSEYTIDERWWLWMMNMNDDKYISTIEWKMASK